METAKELKESAQDMLPGFAYEYVRDVQANTTEMMSQTKLYSIHLSDAFAWLEAREENSIHAIVTDPPYGLKEYTDIEKTKLRNGRGGVWRIPPSFDGCKRSPLPRFTILDDTDITALCSFFTKFAKQAARILVPGGHVMIATNPLLSQYVYMSMIAAGLEKRGEIIRLVQTLRGGDRPKFMTYPLCLDRLGNHGAYFGSPVRVECKTIYESGQREACVVFLARIHS